MSLAGDSAGFALMQVPSPIRQMLGGPSNSEISEVLSTVSTCSVLSTVGKTVSVASFLGAVLPSVVFAVDVFIETLDVRLAVIAPLVAFAVGGSFATVTVALAILGVGAYAAAKVCDYMKDASLDSITSKTWGYVPSELAWAKG